MKKINGFTLVELMVSITLGLVVIGAVLSVFLASSATDRISKNRARIQENARFALGLIEHDLRMAGQMGCFNIASYPNKFKNLAISPTSFENNYDAPIVGYDSANSAWTPTIDNNIGIFGHAPIAGSDVFVVRIPIAKQVPLSVAMINTSDVIQISNTNDFKVGSGALISDCIAANIFKITAITPNADLSHGISLNTNVKLSKIFSTDALIVPIASVSYFLAASSDGITSHKSLWRQVGLVEAEEIADGVERMEIEYGIDTDVVPDLIVNSFVTANNITATKPVIAVKVALLFVSSGNNVAIKQQTYTFEGVTNISGTNGRIYVPFTTTVSLRNRVN